jgi:Transmembrane secretion effector
MAASLIGDGIFFVALPWLVLGISDSAATLGLVGLVWTIPSAVFALVGGVVSDRMDRRHVMIAGDVVRCGATVGIGVLAVLGDIRIWHVLLLIAVFGLGEALFIPGFGAVVPEIVPTGQLVQANAIDQFVRPLALRLLGPAIGGVTVATLGVGQAVLVDAATFGLSALAISVMAARPRLQERGTAHSAIAEMLDGYRFIRAHTWLWASLLAAAVASFMIAGPWNVLVPFVIRNDLGGSARDFGFVLAAGGVGAVSAALVVGHGRLARRAIGVTYASWALTALGLAGFDFLAGIWQALLASFVINAALTVGTIVWATLLQTLVPSELLGRVFSIDWFISSSLIPISFGVAGGVAASIGAGTTLLVAGTAGAVGVLLFLRIPGVRSIEDSETLRELHAPSR